MKADITNFNLKNQYHGYQEWYWDNKLSYRGNYKNGKEIGYEEWHRRNKTTFYII